MCMTTIELQTLLSVMLLDICFRPLVNTNPFIFIAQKTKDIDFSKKDFFNILSIKKKKKQNFQTLEGMDYHI